MSVACTVAQSQERAFNPRMLSKFFSTMVKTASLALGEIPSVPEKVVPEKVRPRKGRSGGLEPGPPESLRAARPP